jgi:hypothetical protein
MQFVRHSSRAARRTSIVAALTLVACGAAWAQAPKGDAAKMDGMQPQPAGGQMQPAGGQMQPAAGQMQGDQMQGGQMGQMQGGQMPGGAMAAEAVTKTFTVQDIDPATRTVTLKATDGTTEKYKCGPEVRNFAQIKKGDQVTSTVMDEIAVDIRKGTDTGPSAGAQQMMSVAPQGAKPSMMMVQTEQMTAKIVAIDTSKRMVTLEGPGGNTKTIKASQKVDLSQLNKGDDVTVRFAQGMAVAVQSPQMGGQPMGGQPMAEPSGGAMEPMAPTTQPK